MISSYDLVDSYKYQLKLFLQVAFTGKIKQLKRFKDDATEVKNGYECGISIEDFNDIKKEDIIEGFEMKETKRKI